jgi:putative phosphoesterase
MRLAVLSDVHGNLAALEAVAEDIARWRPDEVMFAGDIVNRGPRSLDCLRFVQARMHDAGWRVLRGNHEGYVLNVVREPDARPPGIEGAVRENVRWVRQQLGEAAPELETLPERVSLATAGGEVRVVHASMRHDRDNILVDTPDEVLRLQIAPAPELFVVGHTHRPLIRTVDGTLVVNVGSAGLPFDGDWRPSYGRFVLRDGRWDAEIVRITYDRERAAQDFRSSGYLDEGGPVSLLVYDELLTARPRIFGLHKRYGDAVLAGELSAQEAIRRFLVEERVRHSW